MANYEVGLGKTYSTIQAALDALFVAVGTTPFTETQTISVFNGTYTELATPDYRLVPTTTYRLIVKAAIGNSPIIDGGGVRAGCFTVSASAIGYVTIDGFECKNGTGENISLWAPHCRADNCVSHDGSGSQILLRNFDVCAYNCTAYNSAFVGIYLNSGGGGKTEGYDNRQGINIMNSWQNIVTSKNPDVYGNPVSILRLNWSDGVIDFQGGGTNWVAIDFGIVRNVKRMRLFHWGGYGLTSGVLETSTDGITWTPQTTTSSYSGSQQFDIVITVAVDTRYLRISVGNSDYEDTSVHRWIIKSMRVFGDTGGKLKDLVSSVNLLQSSAFTTAPTITAVGTINSTVSPISKFINTALDPIERNILWKVGDGEGVKLEWDREYLFERIVISFAEGHIDTGATLLVEVSKDGTTWVTALTQVGGLVAGYNNFTFPDIQGKFVRITLISTAETSNYISDIQMFGNWIYDEPSRISNCTVYNCAIGLGLNAVGNNFIIENCNVHDCDTETWSMGIFGTVGDLKVMNCLAYHNLVGGIEHDGIGKMEIYNCRAKSWASFSGAITINPYGLGIPETIIKNCILEADDGYCILAIDDSSLNIISDYNDIYPTVSGKAGYFGTTIGDLNTLANWQSATSQDANSISADPLYVNAGAFDFHLTASSPCIDIGTDLTALGVTDDLDSVPRPKNYIFDIGTYEVQQWTKGLSDSVSESDGTAGKNAKKSLSDSVSESDVLVKKVALSLSDSVTVVDADTEGVRIPLFDSVSESDSLTKSIGITLFDSVTAVDADTEGVSIPLFDSVSGSDTLIKDIAIILSDSVSETDSIVKDNEKSLLDSVTATDADYEGVAIPLFDSISESDAITSISFRNEIALKQSKQTRMLLRM